MTDEAFRPEAAPHLVEYIRAHYGSIPRFCEAKGLDRIKVQRAINGDIKRIDVDFAFDIEHATEGEVKAEEWRLPDEVREELRKRRSEANPHRIEPKEPPPESSRTGSADPETGAA